MIAKAIAHELNNVTGLKYDADGTTGNVFVDWMPDTPDHAVAVMSAAGLPQLSKLPHDLPAVQIICRGDTQNAVDAYATARAIYDHLTCMDAVTLAEGTADEVYVIGCTSMQSSPAPIGRDDRDRPEYSTNYQLRIFAPTTNRPAEP